MLRGRILEAFGVHKWPHDASKGASRAPKWDPGASKIHQKIGLGPPWLPRGGPTGLGGTPQSQILTKNIKKIDSNSTENVQKTFAKQCKLTLKNAVEIHLEVHCYLFCEAKFKESVTAAGWAKPTRITKRFKNKNNPKCIRIWSENNPKSMFNDFHKSKQISINDPKAIPKR